LPIDAALAERLHRRARAERWNLPLELFAAALERAAERGANLDNLHLEDLALACACAAGDEAAWEHFIREHRPTLYRAADALDPGGSARELADGIYGELFARSLFSYFHGRSSLGTWLRAVLAQRHVDRVRAGRRLEPLSEDRSSASVGADLKVGPSHTAVETEHERDRCRELIQDALTRTISDLPARDRIRLACYYAQELTLAETGKLLGEHEATCSRHLARTRKALRGTIEAYLKRQHSLREAEIAECFASVSQDPGELDLHQLLRMQPASAEDEAQSQERASTKREARSREPDRKESADDRSTVRGRR
jgi:RNA polymerase sigma-70 factor, ECF subfamily